MTLAEMEDFLDGWQQGREERWEMVRSVVHSTYQSQSTRPIAPASVMSFVWDEPETDRRSEGPTHEDRVAAEVELRNFLARQNNG